ncbi:MAG: hypothetical protein CL578_05915 [Alteromonadaceae bacterium]|nr:hypothetical protein [Alteromonadaceae bacterium]
MLMSKKLNRAFDIRGTIIDCPMPDATLDESIRSLSKSNPLFRQTKIYEEEGQVVGDRLIYKLHLPPPKAKG